MVMAMIGPMSSRAPRIAASIGVLPPRTWRSTFSTTTIASSTTSPDRQHDGEEGQQIEREAQRLHQEDPADERDSGIAASELNTGTERAKE